MKLSGHEINSQLRQKLDMPTGRHLYVVLGSYERLERYEKVDFREALSPTGQKLSQPVNINHELLERIPDNELKRLVQTEASRTESVKDRLTKELDALVAEKLNGGSLVALKGLEILFAYDLELNCLRIRAANQKHILLLLPGEKVGDRVTLFHEAPAHNHRTLPHTYVQENHLWELSE
jgi:hypothetical protein